MKTHNNLLLLSVSVALLPYHVAAQTEASGNCTTFNWDQQPGYIVNGTTMRVSGAATCESKQNETHACPITASGDAQESFSHTSSTGFQDSTWNTDSFLHSLMLNAVNASLGGASWPYYTIGIIDTIQTLEPGTSGYINFTNLERCFEGTMSDCTGGLEDGFTIRGCAPVVNPIRGGDSPPFLDGIYTVVEIPEDTVGQYRNPYSGQVRGSGAQLQSSLAAVALGLALTFVAWI